MTIGYMMVIATCFLVLASSSLPADAETDQAHGQALRLSYSFELLTAPRLEVRIRVRMHGDRDGQTVAEVSDHWGGVSAGGEDIDAVAASDASGVPLRVERPAAHQIIVFHEPAADITISYAVPANNHQQQSDPSQFRRPVLNSHLFHTVGHLALLRPADLADDTWCRIRFEWHGFDEMGWNVVTSWGIGTETREITESLQNVMGSLLLAGEFTLLTRDIRGYPLTVTVDGDQWKFTADEFADLAAGVVEVEREFFGDFERAFYWISLVPAGTPQQDGYSIGGTGLRNCFSLGVTPNAGLGHDEPDGAELLRILAHEMFHEWNGLVIRREDPEELVYWFSEGFTDFYARRLLHRGGWIDAQAYAASVNKTFEHYTVSPVRNARNDRILEDFWSDPHVQRLPYLRGDIIAMLMDAAIRRRSGMTQSLDDLMRQLVAEARDGQRVSVDLLIKRFGDFADSESADMIRSIVVDGRLPEIPDDLFAPCLRVENVPVCRFDLGFDFETSTDTRQIVGVRQRTLAYEAGLRDGMVLKGWSVRRGDVNREVVLRIEDAGREKKIAYLPRGPMIEAPQVVQTGDGRGCDDL